MEMKDRRLSAKRSSGAPDLLGPGPRHRRGRKLALRENPRPQSCALRDPMRADRDHAPQRAVLVRWEDAMHRKDAGTPEVRPDLTPAACAGSASMRLIAAHAGHGEFANPRKNRAAQAVLRLAVPLPRSVSDADRSVIYEFAMDRRWDIIPPP